MNDLKNQITDLAALMEEFGLRESTISGPDWKVSFSRTLPASGPVAVQPVADEAAPAPAPKAQKPAAPVVTGTPVTTPMMGIFYSSPSPGSPAFCKEGDLVTAGQVVGLIEAMKVFNEITSPVAGKVVKLVAENGQLVQPGDALVIVG